MKNSIQQDNVVDWVEHDKGSLNLVARAGCGKTTTLIIVAKKIAELNLGTIALLAFNRSIADEIKLKTQNAGLRNVKASTVHSAGFGAWTRINRNVKVDEKKVGDIIKGFSRDENDFYAKNLGSICHLVSLAKQCGFGFLVSVDDDKAWFDLAEHHGVNDLAEGDTTEDLVSHSIPVLKKSLAMDRQVIDYDDMILAPLAHQASIPHYDWVLLDEAQDTNPIRRALALKMMKSVTGRLIAVGDDRQAIYGFTGADADAMERIRLQLNSKVLPLNVTYRCPKEVVKEANKFVPDLIAHETAPDGIVRSVPYYNDKLEPWYKTPPDKTSAILCRNTKPLVLQAYAFIRVGIGCRIEGREIGAGLIALIRKWKRVTNLYDLSEKLSDYQVKEMQKWIEKEREEKAQAIKDKVETIQVLIQKMLEENKNSIDALVQFIQTLFGDSKPGIPPSVVTLSTVHKAKGREWDVVYILDRAGLMPSAYAKNEWQKLQEENLEYVAITRAKKELVDIVFNKKGEMK